MESGRKSGKKVARNSQCLLNVSDMSESTSDGPAIILGSSRPSSDAKDRKTFRIEPPTDLLSRLNAFLPQIAEANKKLEVAVAEDPHKLDIENVDKNEEQYIEMDLGLGVFDMKPKKDIKSMDGILIHDIPATAESDSDEEDDSSGDEDQESISENSRIIISPSSILKRNKALKPPGIKVIGGSDAHSSTSGSSSDEHSSSDSSSDSGSDSDSNSSSLSSSDNDVTMAE
ncbi:hypothetical protein GGF39_000740 [Coemansia sp. RSA 1721]|nr:hypothetical protein GGF39_000740 [Coemansia sp. RSA 1721]